MRNTIRNVFFALGCLAVAVMLLGSDLTWTDVRDSLRTAGYSFPAIIALWAGVYVLNAFAWQIILNSGEDGRRVPFAQVYRFTVTGFALNSVTPMGLMGGEPYRILETLPYVGVEKATSSVVLYVMMHIFSHFCFWLLSVVLYLGLHADSLNGGTATLLGLTVAVCSLGIYFFTKGYRSGLLVKLFRGLSRLPLAGKKARRFLEQQEEKLKQTDALIAGLHRNHRRVFYTSLLAELTARILSCAEVFIILSIFVDHVSYADCIIILAFTSLFANALFFLPMQMGAREGGFAMIVNGLAFPYGYGVVMGVIIRLRELVCVCMGLALMKIGNRTPVKPSQPTTNLSEKNEMENL